METSSFLSVGFTTSYTYDLSIDDKKNRECIWKIEECPLFDELILSWNGRRPFKGKWVFWVSLCQEDKWSSWIRYAEWAPHSQRTFQYAQEGSWIESYQDVVYPKDGDCRAFQVKITAEGGASLDACDTLYVCISFLDQHAPSPPDLALSSVLLPNVPCRSQIQLDHPRAQDLCSPTSITTAINFLSKETKVDPVAFAAKAHDCEFDIYGNWILNTAQAYIDLCGRFRVQVKRLQDFSTLHSYLMRKLPVVVSIRGPLIGSSHPLTFGHLICVIGYDPEKQEVLCIDSGFAEDIKTFVSYPLQDFLLAWGRRQQVAYVFEPKKLETSLAKRLSKNS